MRGGKREGAGRKKGSPNKASIARQEEVAASGITPLEYMLGVMRNTNASDERRDEAAKAAAPYVHPRLAATEVSGKGGGPIQAEVEVVEVSGRDLARAVLAVLREANVEGKA